MSFRIILIFLSLICIAQINGQEYPILTHYELDPDGSGSKINDFFIDEQGYKVIKIRSTFYYFEGEEIYPYRMSPIFVPDSLEAMITEKIKVSDSLQIFLCKEGSIIKVNNNDKTYQHFQSEKIFTYAPTNKKFSFLRSFGKNKIAFREYLNGFWVFDLETERFTLISPNAEVYKGDLQIEVSNRIRDLCTIPGSNKLWLVGVSGLFSYDGESGELDYYGSPSYYRTFKDTAINRIIAGENGEIITSSWPNGIATFNPKNKSWRTYPHPLLLEDDDEFCIGRIVIYRDGRLLTNYRNFGTYLIDLKTGEFEKYIAYYTDKGYDKKKQKTKVNHFHIDDEKNVYILQERGYISVDFTITAQANVKQYSMNNIEKLWVDTSNHYTYIVGVGGHIFVEDTLGTLSKYSVEKVGKSGEESAIYDIEILPNNELYFLGNKAIYRINKNRKRLDSIAFPAWGILQDDLGEAYDFHYDNQGTWWIPTKQSGVFRLRNWSDKAGPIPYTYPLESNANLMTFWTDIEETKDGTIWISSEQALFYAEEGSTAYQVFDDNYPISDNRKFGIVRDMDTNNEGQLVVSTKSGNVGLMTKNSDGVPEIMVLSRLGRTIKDIECDEYGNVWILLLDGMTRLNIEHGHQVFFGDDYGLDISRSGKIQSLENGKMALIRNGGVLSVFNPQTFQPLPIEALFQTTHIRKHNENWVSLKGQTTPLILESTENYLSFRFHSPQIWSNRDLIIQYRLKNLNPSWTTVQSGREAHFTNIPGGNFDFQVRAAMSYNALENARISSLPIKIKIPFYNQSLFKIGLLMLTMLTLALIWRQRIRRIKREEKIKRDAFEREEQLKTTYQRKLLDLEMAALRAQMNPHFLFNSLNSIRHYIIERDIENAERYLGQFADLVRMVLNNVREKYVPIASELELIHHFISLEKMRYSKVFDYALTIDESIDIEYVLIPPMLIQPFVENAIWHGLMHKENGPLELKIGIKRTEDFIFCNIMDNGIGREQAATYTLGRQSKHKSLSTDITDRRLKLLQDLHGKESEIQIEDLYDQEGGAMGTKVMIKLPWYEA